MKDCFYLENRQMFHQPCGIATDRFGNVYVANYESNTIVKINSNRSASVLIGNTGFDDGPLRSAKINRPCGLAVDWKGNIYFSDTNNNCIRRISVDGIVTTIAGSPRPGLKDGLGPSAQFSNPSGISLDIDRDILYVADRGNCAIRKVTQDGNVTTILSGSTYFKAPVSVLYDSGTLYVVDQAGNQIKSVCLHESPVLPKEKQVELEQMEMERLKIEETTNNIPVAPSNPPNPIPVSLTRAQPVIASPPPSTTRVCCGRTVPSTWQLCPRCRTRFDNVNPNQNQPVPSVPDVPGVPRKLNQPVHQNQPVPSVPDVPDVPRKLNQPVQSVPRVPEVARYQKPKVDVKRVDTISCYSGQTIQGLETRATAMVEGASDLPLGSCIALLPQDNLSKYVDIKECLILPYGQDFDEDYFKTLLKYANYLHSKIKSEFPQLTPTEAHAIYFYTCEWRNRDVNTYSKLNVCLTSPKRENASNWRFYLRHLFSALSKLPVWKPTQDLYRGVPVDLVTLYPKKYQVGQEIIWYGFTSTTCQLNQAKKFLPEKKHHTIFTINNNITGRRISTFSAISQEEEILFPPGSRFAIVSIAQYPQVSLIQLNQLEPLEDFLAL
eukprot:TRINITY_DN1748_c0_g1_i1.p1 TRINITY_DN1748_c0_g1~~TRINITY_DN1748_c0_g1_i1.p1  ORF type:complete len:713 (+),score=90.19 TRINITY_DN1748_c0_g1_i1:321-2141(+)